MPTDLALARRAVACHGWRWMPGMRVLSDGGAPGTITGYQSPQPGRVDVAWDGGVVTHSFDPARLTLIVDAPPTLGCLLGLLREAWGSTAHLVRLQTHDRDLSTCVLVPACWWALATGLTSVPLLLTDSDGHGYYLAGPSEPAALVAALEAAPVKP